ncbi:hypothetical protein TVAG_482480 [Trichomonas vaginalis G3]|uniref:DUF3447 domain-containing protein n=1 Tax=Trichomonas vaginalis (strain ATCC PRA-98 / G3) TaxID=412133 RepID=A2G4U2_TRIV3|nr:protein ubiquitination [Trichomonas vaginalis G3]EAX87823.1 hypothetical protein TVAG_482480 [Trichomonas vaginalis G3]KAI5535547.1 protein ubiquitination [Trichomonas vaginalis G3]|eukprot:XP_001300753.1 hypothetical protein [Trichomonas vaginalis G3]
MDEKEIIGKFTQFKNCCKIIWSVADNNIEEIVSQMSEFIENKIIEIETVFYYFGFKCAANPLLIRSIFTVLKSIYQKFKVNQIHSTIYSEDLHELLQKYKMMECKHDISCDEEKIYDVYDKNSVNYFLLHDDVENLIKFVEENGMDVVVSIEEFIQLLVFSNILDIAAFYGSENCFKFLLNSGMKPGRETFYAAICGGNFTIISIVDQIQNKADGYCADLSVLFHHNDVYEFLHSKYNVECCWLSPIKSGNIDIFEEMMESNCMRRDRTGKYPLISATSVKIKELIPYIILKATHPDIMDSSEDTSLMIACKNGDLEAVKILIENGANINFCNQFDMSALLFAADYHRYNVFEYLMKNGADLKAKDSQGNEFPIMIHLIGNDSETNEETLIFYKRVLNCGVNINGRGLNGDTPLHIAVMNNNVSLVRFLLENDADISIKNEMNQDPLQIAEENAYQDIIDILVKEI